MYCVPKQSYFNDASRTDLHCSGTAQLRIVIKIFINVTENKFVAILVYIQRTEVIFPNSFLKELLNRDCKFLLQAKDMEYRKKKEFIYFLDIQLKLDRANNELIRIWFGKKNCYVKCLHF